MNSWVCALRMLIPNETYSSRSRFLSKALRVGFGKAWGSSTCTENMAVYSTSRKSSLPIENHAFNEFFKQGTYGILW